METSNKLFIGNLNRQTRRQELKDHFGQYGEVAYASIGRDREKRRSKGFGFITFVNEEDAIKVKEMNDQEQMELMSRPLYIEYARPREDDEFNNNEDKSVLEKVGDAIEDVVDDIKETVEDAVESITGDDD